MITLRTFEGPVYMISKNGIDIVKNISDTKLKKFQAPSDAVLVEIIVDKKSKEPLRVEVAIGRDVTPEIFKLVCGFAFTRNLQIIIRETETLDHLYEIDQMIVLANSYLKLPNSGLDFE